jgi:F-type H+-transporting ATPase subunit epsilon
MPLPETIRLEVVTPEGLLLREDVDEVIAPGADGYFGVRPGHTPMLASLGAGAITYKKSGKNGNLSCFWGFCEVLPDRVNILAEIGERAEDIDVGRAAQAKAQAEARLKHVKDEAGYEEAHQAYIRAVTRLSVATRQRQP